MLRRLPFLLILVIAVVSHSHAWAQVAGATLSGTISDPSGAVIPFAMVSLRDNETGIVRSVTGDSAALYTAPNLRPSTYDVTVSFPGFSTRVQSGITLTVGAEQVLNRPRGEPVPDVRFVGEHVIDHVTRLPRATSAAALRVSSSRRGRILRASKYSSAIARAARQWNA